MRRSLCLPLSKQLMHSCCSAEWLGIMIINDMSLNGAYSFHDSPVNPSWTGPQPMCSHSVKVSLQSASTCAIVVQLFCRETVKQDLEHPEVVLLVIPRCKTCVVWLCGILRNNVSDLVISQKLHKLNSEWSLVFSCCHCLVPFCSPDKQCSWCEICHFVQRLQPCQLSFHISCKIGKWSDSCHSQTELQILNDIALMEKLSCRFQ